MKTCPRCKQSLPLSSFRKFTDRGRNRVRYQSYCIECNKTANKEHYEANKTRYAEKAREYKRLRGGPQASRHGLTADLIADLKSKYAGKCWICKSREAVVVDHDHACCAKNSSCGKCVRGMLCKSCNTGVGLLGDSVEGLQKALTYLIKASSFNG